VALILAGGVWDTASLLADDALQHFEAKVRPVLVEHCQKCHGVKKQSGGLRLDSRQGLLTGGDNGPAIVPGKPDESLLIVALRQTGDLEMPPAGKLPDMQIEAVVEWVRAGAPWPATVDTTAEKLREKQRGHWAFQPIGHPVPPEVHEAGWIRTPVDRFVLAKLEAAELPHAPPADRRTLIRRVTFDLTGLPPSAEQVEAFIADSSPDAYAKLVDRLLDSPQYGEQWARHWFDVARYSDTKGYVYAREERFWVHAPAYRDWVVKAFNQDLPYDKFLLLQIAADQAAPDDRAASAAMGFLTLGRRFLGVTHDIIDDRIDVVTRGTMGLTVACARCHDHKYDPIPTADYYSLYSVFLNSGERMEQIAEPATRDDAYAAFEKELQQREQKRRDTLLAKSNEASDRCRGRVTDYLIAQTELSKHPEEGFDTVILATDLNPQFIRRWEQWLAMEARLHDPAFLPWRRLAALPAEGFASRAESAIRELIASGAELNPRVVQMLSPTPASMREVAERYGKLLTEAEQEWKGARERAKAAGMPEPTKLDAPELEALRQVLYGVGSPCLVPDEPIVSTEWYFDSATVVEMWKLQGEVDRWLIQQPLSPPFAVSLVDRDLKRQARIFRRGNPANRGPDVAPHFVSVVAGPQPAPFTQGSGRLELAKAIIDPSNPLTARVWVNRIWQHHFGAGLVRTPSDFGIRAETPSHPELLDWLATQLVANGWSTKSVHRLIVLSNTYQQVSEGSADPTIRARVNQVDPENRLLSRMNVRRLTFEEFRDTLLAVTGRLDLRMGGRASDMFAGNGTAHNRRTLYGLVDRQFLPATLRMFDFANPDLHTPARVETTVPQQALFALNHPFIAQQARELLARANAGGDMQPADRIRRMYRAAYQREPSPVQLETALAFVNAAETEAGEKPSAESLAWQYGYGELDASAKQLKSFQPLPHFTGSAWQGSAQWPDPKLGWVQVTGKGGHPGNDLQHCAIRRWVAPRDGTFAITYAAVHEVAVGNGIRCSIFSSRGGQLTSFALHNSRQDASLEAVTLQKGDTLDFVVDINGDLNSDQFLWAPMIRDASSNPADPMQWSAERDFTGPPVTLLSPWEQLAQVLLIANELMFVD
jgi:mono/diheme cytochrome c family protein